MKIDNFIKIPLLICLSFLFILLVFNYTPLDFYVNAGFVKGLVEHGEFTFVSGNPFYGFTSPLWIILNGLTAYLTGINILLILKIVGISLSLISIPLVFLLSKKTGLRERYLFVITILWAINPYFLLNSVSGYETPLFILLVLLAFLELDNPILSGILIGLSILTRPEGIILLAIPIFKSFNDKRYLISIILTLLITAFWLVYSQTHFGTFVPRPLLLNARYGEPTRQLLPLLPFVLIFLIIVLDFFTIWPSIERIVNTLFILFIIGTLVVAVPVFQNKLIRTDEFARTTTSFLSILRKEQCKTLATDNGEVAYLSGMKIVDYNGMLSYVPSEYRNEPVLFIRTNKPCYLLGDEGYVQILSGFNLTAIHSETIEHWSVLESNKTFTLYKFNWGG